MKTNFFSVNSLIYITGFVALLVAPLSASAYTHVPAIFGLQAGAGISLQAADTDRGAAENENENSEGTKKNSADVEKQKKQCDMARKNLALLRADKGGRSFKTTEGTLVRYSPDQMKQMIEDSEIAEKESCE